MNAVLTPQDMDRALTRVAHEILEKNPGPELPVLVGIRTRGEPLAARLAAKISEILKTSGRAATDAAPLVGVLDIGLYRDDVRKKGPKARVGQTALDFGIDERVVVLVDDVLYTGRTIRSALNALVDYGRPRLIQLAVLIDRGHRELPIRADFVGKNLPTSAKDRVSVKLSEIDGEDAVVIESAGDKK